MLSCLSMPILHSIDLNEKHRPKAPATSRLEVGASLTQPLNSVSISRLDSAPNSNTQRTSKFSRRINGDRNPHCLSLEKMQWRVLARLSQWAKIWTQSLCRLIETAVVVAVGQFRLARRTSRRRSEKWVRPCYKYRFLNEPAEV